MRALSRSATSSLLAGLLASGALAHAESAGEHRLVSPGGRLALTFRLTPDGQPSYALSLGSKVVLRESRLGIALADGPGLTSGFVVDGVEEKALDETWRPVWGEERQIRDNHRELAVSLRQPSANNRRLVLRFRLFDDGLGFRYEIPRQQGVDYLVVSDEKTEFALTGDHKAFWIPGDSDSQEYTYTTSPLSQIDATISARFTSIAVRSLAGPDVVQTPLMMKTADGLYVNIHEAALVDYPAMMLKVDRPGFTLTSELVPDAVGNKAYLQTPCRTPWRTVVMSDKATEILASRLILNLNEPSKIADTSWIKPRKFVGIWWAMHVGTATWNYADSPNVKLADTDWAALTPNGRHGASTENTKRYIDFAAKHGIDAVLVEGWNVGWEDWFGHWKEEVFDFVTPYPDFDVQALHAYAASKGVLLVMHHETSSSVTNYERRIDDAFRFMKQNGYDTVKTGYVGRIIPRGEHHDGAWMVDHYLRVAEKAARQQIMIDSHEAVRPTGLQRTWPNWLAAESARGNEYNAWSEGNPPEHETILPFTRLMGGPMDYTPGIFQIKLDVYAPGKRERVHTTLAKQLALYVTLYSPLQMAADLPENYERFPDAFRFVEDVAVDWDETHVLEAEPGDYVTIARKAKGRDAWFVGAISDEQARTATIPLSWLGPGASFVATLYTDAPDAHWDTNPMAYRIQSVLVDGRTVLKLRLAPGGGAAVSIRPSAGDEAKKLKRYEG
jgi:hypothetical protein